MTCPFVPAAAEQEIRVGAVVPDDVRHLARVLAALEDDLVVLVVPAEDRTVLATRRQAATVDLAVATASRAKKTEIESQISFRPWVQSSSVAYLVLPSFSWAERVKHGNDNLLSPHSAVELKFIVNIGLVTALG